MSSAEEEIMSEDLYHEQEPLGGKPSAGKYTGRIGRRPSDPVRMRKKNRKEKQMSKQKQRKEQRVFKEFDTHLEILGLTQTRTAPTAARLDIWMQDGVSSTDSLSKTAQRPAVSSGRRPSAESSAQFLKEAPLAERNLYYRELDNLVRNSETAFDTTRERIQDLKQRLRESSLSELDDSWSARKEGLTVLEDVVAELRHIKTDLEKEGIFLAETADVDKQRYIKIMKEVVPDLADYICNCGEALKAGLYRLKERPAHMLVAFGLVQKHQCFVECLTDKKQPLLYASQKDLTAFSRTVGQKSGEIIVAVAAAVHDFQQDFFCPAALQAQYGKECSGHEEQDHCRRLQTGWARCSELAERVGKAFPEQADLMSRERCKMMLHAAGEANQMQRGLPGFKDLKDSKCEEKGGQDGKGAWGVGQIYEPLSGRTLATDDIMQAQAWAPACLRDLLTEANLAASSLDSISSSRRDPLLNSLSKALHELAITTNSRLAAYFVEPSNLSHWALQACEEQLCGAVTFVVELDRGALGGTEISTKLYNSIRDSTYLVVNSILYVRRLIAQKQQISNEPANSGPKSGPETSKHATPTKPIPIASPPKLARVMPADKSPMRPTKEPPPSSINNRPQSRKQLGKGHSKAAGIPAMGLNRLAITPVSSFEDHTASKHPRVNGKQAVPTQFIRPVLGESPTQPKQRPASHARGQNLRATLETKATAKPLMQPPRPGPMPPLAPSNPSQVPGKQVTDASAKLPPRHIHTASSNFDHVPTTGGPFAAIIAQQQSQSPRSIQSTHAPLSQPREPVMVFPQKEPPRFEQTVRFWGSIEADLLAAELKFGTDRPPKSPKFKGSPFAMDSTRPCDNWGYNQFFQQALEKQENGLKQTPVMSFYQLPGANSLQAKATDLPITPKDGLKAKASGLSAKVSNTARKSDWSSSSRLALRDSEGNRSSKRVNIIGRLADRIPSSRQAITMNGPSSDPIHGHYITQAAAVLNIARSSSNSPSSSKQSSSPSSRQPSSSESSASSDSGFVPLDQSRIIPHVSNGAIKAQYDALYKSLVKWKADPFWQISWEQIWHDQVIKPENPKPELGRGSFATVMQGRLHGSSVAIKVFTFEGRGVMEILETFKREVDLQKSLSLHQYIVRFSGACCDLPAIAPEDSDTSKIRLAIVMELCSYGSLRSVIKEAAHLARSVPADVIARKRKPENQQQFNLMRYKGYRPYTSWHTRLSLARHAAAGVEFMHAKGISHRDLTSSNILVTNQFEAKVSDFGLSVAISEKPDRMLLNSVCWAAPEKIQAVPGYDPKAADVYSFGVILWELLTLKEPWADRGPSSSNDDSDDFPTERTFSERERYALFHVPKGERLLLPTAEQIEPELPELQQVNELIEACCKQDPTERPNMVQVGGRLLSILGHIRQRELAARKPP